MKQALKQSKIREYAEAIIIAILIALFIRTFIVQAFKIPSGSMKPTLQIGDHILVNKFIYGIKIPFIRSTLIPISDPKEGGHRRIYLSTGPLKGFHKKGDRCWRGYGGDEKQAALHQRKAL